MDEEWGSNLVVLNSERHAAADAGELASDDKSDSDNGSATDEEDINVTLARALADVPCSVDGKRQESQKRFDTGATESLEKPLDTCTAKANEKVPPSPEKKKR